MLRIPFCVVILSVINFSSANSIPPFIKLCSVSDPKLQDCMIKHGHEAIPYIVKGSKEYSIPNMQPLKLDRVEFNAGNLKIMFNDMEVKGLENAKIVAAGFKPKEQIMYFDLIIPRVDINAQYKTRGRILLLPLEGNGPVDIVLHDGRYNCTVNLENMTPDSKKPIVFKDSSVKFYVEDSHYNFQNLFNGNKQLGDNINNVLNDNHESLNTEFNGVFAETINTVIKSIVTGIIDNIYYKDAFLP